MGNDGDSKQLIMKVEFNTETKAIDIDICTKHIPTLSHLVKILDYEITERLAQEKVKKEVDTPVIHVVRTETIKPAIRAAGNIINRIRRK